VEGGLNIDMKLDIKAGKKKEGKKKKKKSERKPWSDRA